VPVFLKTEERGTDFNDLAALRGPGPVAEIIRAALAEHDEPPDDDPDPGSAPDDDLTDVQTVAG
jgi:hypothetical protein